VADDLGCFANQRLARHAFDLHGVVCYEAVTTLYVLDRRFALTDTAVAEQEHALAVYLNEHAVTVMRGASCTFKKAMSAAMKSLVISWVERRGTPYFSAAALHSAAYFATSLRRTP
jgi:hypothetical protein